MTYSFIVIIGVPANCIVISIVKEHLPCKPSLDDFERCRFNDSVGLPGMYDFSLNKVRLDKTMGDFLCKFFVGNALVRITVNVGAVTVCTSTFAVARYLALVKPFNTGIILTNFVMSLFAVLSYIPDFLTNAIEPDLRSIYPCKRPWSVDEYFYHKGFIIYGVVL